MPYVMRWSVCLVVCGLLGASAPVRSQAPDIVLFLDSPRQWVEVPDENGTVRRAQFEAQVRAYEDGRVRGGAVLDLGNQRCEFRIHRLLVMETDGPMALAVTVQVRMEANGTIARLLIDKGFGFIRDEGGIEHSLEIVLDFHVRDGVVCDMPPLEADGTLLHLVR